MDSGRLLPLITDGAEGSLAHRILHSFSLRVGHLLVFAFLFRARQLLFELLRLGHNGLDPTQGLRYDR